MRSAIRFLLFYSLTTASVLNAQFAIGPKVYTRLTDDRVGPTTGFGLHATYLMDEGYLVGIGGGGFDISIPQYFGGTARMDAWDSATTPYSIIVPCEKKITDYTLRMEFGYAINPKQRSNSWIVTLELRGMFRRVKINYLQSFNESAYSRYTLETDPYIPAALNVGLNVGAGYMLAFKSFALYPHAGFGFGSNDRRNKHPWNFYPNYFELSLSVLYVTPFD